ncbi:hypothetical protein IV102_11945 [bacterium]|nr:hypothetical protein [bacterium]
MNSPPQPGQRRSNWRVERVLSWGRRGGLYRVETEAGARIVKEIRLPPLPPELAQQRLQQCLTALQNWQQMRLPQAVTLEQVQTEGDSLLLLLPVLVGQPVSLQGGAFDSFQLLDWAEQLCELVLALQRHQHPLAMACLEPDHVLVDASGGLLVFNPGWSELAWRGADELSRLPVQQGLRKFAELLVWLASGSAPAEALPNQLSPALMWMVGRCLSEDPTRQYANFEEVRLALRTGPGDGPMPSRSGCELLDDFPLPDLTPEAAKPMKPWLRGLMVASAVLALACLGTALHRTRTGVGRTTAGLALALGDRVLLLGLRGESQFEMRFANRIQCMAASPDGERIFVGLQGENGLTVVGRASHSVTQLPGSGAPTQLQMSQDGLQLLGCLDNGKVGSWSLDTGGPKWRGESWLDASGEGASLTGAEGQAGLLLLKPHRGLLLISRGRAPVSWNHSGVNSALSLEGLVVAVVSEERSLYALHSDLQPMSKRELPGGPGLTQLLKDPYRRQFWAVHERGQVSVWGAPTLTRTGELLLPSAPRLACTDPVGCLWVLSEEGNLLKLQSSPPRWQMRGQVGQVEQASALIYLSLPVNQGRAE